MSILTELALVIADAAEVEKASGGLPQMDASTFAGQLFWLAITFGILYAVMNMVILPGLGGTIEERKDRIADDLDQAAEFQQQAETAQSAYEKALSDARAKAQGIAQETRKTMDDEISALQTDMETQIQSKLESAEKRITEMQASAAAKVREAAIDTTKAVVETLIDEVPTQEAVEKALSS